MPVQTKDQTDLLKTFLHQLHLGMDFETIEISSNTHDTITFDVGNWYWKLPKHLKDQRSYLFDGQVKKRDGFTIWYMVGTSACKRETDEENCLTTLVISFSKKINWTPTRLRIIGDVIKDFAKFPSFLSTAFPEPDDQIPIKQ